MCHAGTCDSDVEQVCGKVNTPRARGVWSIGVVGRCLSRQLAENKKLAPECRKLVTVAAPKDAQVNEPAVLLQGSQRTQLIVQK